MLVIWSLFAMWVVFNLFDVVISWLAIQSGATEIGFLYREMGFWVASGTKMALALVIGGLLIWARKQKWLVALNVGMLAIVLWNCFVVRVSL